MNQYSASYYLFNSCMFYLHTQRLASLPRCGEGQSRSPIGAGSVMPYGHPVRERRTRGFPFSAR